jgi:hypothetical protein
MLESKFEELPDMVEKDNAIRLYKYFLRHRIHKSSA